MLIFKLKGNLCRGNNSKQIRNVVFCVCRLTYTFMGKRVDKNTASDRKLLLNEYLGLLDLYSSLSWSFLQQSTSFIILSLDTEYFTMFVLCEPTLPPAFKVRHHSSGDGARKWQTGEEGCILPFISFLAVFNFSFALFKQNYFKPFSFLCCVKIYLLTST